MLYSSKNFPITRGLRHHVGAVDLFLHRSKNFPKADRHMRRAAFATAATAIPSDNGKNRPKPIKGFRAVFCCTGG